MEQTVPGAPAAACVTVDHYARAERRWAQGATLVYGPVAHQLVTRSPHSLKGHRVLDAGAGTGAASDALRAQGAQPVALDRSLPMLSWSASTRPPAMAGEICVTPLATSSMDDSAAAFVLNHLEKPHAAFEELTRVTRRGGCLLACVFSNSSHSEVRDEVDNAARVHGWEPPSWYVEMKERVTPILGTGEDMTRAAKAAQLADFVVEETEVDVGVTLPEQLVDYRFGQAHFSDWLDLIGPVRAEEVRSSAIESIRPSMRPYRPIVVFLSALVARR